MSQAGPGLAQRSPVVVVAAVRQRGRPRDRAGVRVAAVPGVLGLLGCRWPVIPLVVLPAVVVPVCPPLPHAVRLRRVGGLAVRGVRLTLAPRGCAAVLAAEQGRMAQRSPGADVALGRPEGLLCGFAAAAALVVMLVLMLAVMLTPPALRCAFREVCGSPGRRGGLQQGGGGLGFGEGGAHGCGSAVGGSIIGTARRVLSIVDPSSAEPCPREVGLHFTT